MPCARQGDETEGALQQHIRAGQRGVEEAGGEEEKRRGEDLGNNGGDGATLISQDLLQNLDALHGTRCYHLPPTHAHTRTKVHAQGSFRPAPTPGHAQAGQRRGHTARPQDFAARPLGHNEETKPGKIRLRRRLRIRPRTVIGLAVA